MFVKNSFEYDARVTREARTLVDAGHEVTVVAIHVAGVTPRREVEGGVVVVRVDRPSSGLARTLRRFTGRAASTATPGDAGVSPSTTASTSTPRRAARKLVKWLLDLVTPLVRPFRTLALDRRMIAAGIAVGADVYHCHDLNTLRIGTRCVARSGGALLYDAHELHAERNRAGPLARWWSARTERWYLRAVDEVVTASPGYAEYLSVRHGVPRPTVVLNVPEDPGTIRPVDLRSLLDIGADQRIVLYQGSIQENRGLEELIAAVADIDACVLVIVGYGHHRPVLERLVRSRGVEEQIRFHGPVPHEELIRYTADADVGACCIVGSSLSYRLSMPNKLFEYLMAGLPVVASDHGPMGAFVQEHDVGEVCDPTDPRTIASAIRRILDDRERLESARRAAGVASQRYRWNVERERLLDVYRSLDPSSNTAATSEDRT